MSSEHIAKAGGLKGSPTSITIDVYAETDPSRKVTTVPSRDIVRLGDTDVYQVDLRRCSVSTLLDLPSDERSGERGYTLIWRDDAISQVVTTERVRGIAAPTVRAAAPVAFKLFVAGSGLKSESQLAQVRRQLSERFGREPLIEMIDILDNPAAAVAAHVIATPALVQVPAPSLGRPGRT